MVVDDNSLFETLLTPKKEKCLSDKRKEMIASSAVTKKTTKE